MEDQTQNNNNENIQQNETQNAQEADKINENYQFYPGANKVEEEHETFERTTAFLPLTQNEEELITS